MSRQPASPVAHVGGRPIVLPRLSRVMPAVPRPQPARPVPRETAVPRTPSRRPAPRWRMADTAFRLTSLAFALSVLVITGAIAIELFVRSAPARHAFGWSFLWTGVWDPVFSNFGALPFIYGTLATTAIALMIAVPLGLGAAICLAELLPRRIGDALTFLLELLVAVPSVVYGLVGVFVLVPLMRNVGGPVAHLLGGVPLFAPAHTMAAVLANAFAEAVSDVHLAALVEVGLVLFGITLVVNAVARLLILGMRGPERARA